MEFFEFNFEEKVLEALTSMGYETATPIQESAIPIILENQDLIACAQTGTGKTAAFILPIINKIVKNKSVSNGINTLILAPTRELVIQIDQNFEGLAYFTGVSSIPVYGGGDGNAFIQQKRALEKGSDVVIATPGRLIALLNSNKDAFKNLQHLVLDEADRMLDMGFLNDILRIISYLPKERQTLLFSATMPQKIRKLSSKILKNPKSVSLAISKPASGINQQVYILNEEQKLPLLLEILKDDKYESVIVFADTRENAKAIEKKLKKANINAKAFHSDLDMQERGQYLIDFKSGKLPVLIGTDIISRGIDVEGVDLVVNYSLPGDPEDYIHRIGRTARAQSSGTAISFVNKKDQKKLFRIEEMLEDEISKVPLPGELGPGPQLVANNKFKRKKNFKNKPK